MFRSDQATVASCERGRGNFHDWKKNESSGEFLNWGWTGKEEYIFRVGVDTYDKFPSRLHIPGVYESTGVVRLTIAFSTKQAYDKAILRLVRGGVETSVVKVDGQQQYQVTSAMLGSGEDFVCGSYELDIGGLQEGTHTLMFTILEDGKGSGSYQWDVLELFGISGK